MPLYLHAYVPIHLFTCTHMFPHTYVIINCCFSPRFQLQTNLCFIYWGNFGAQRGGSPEHASIIMWNGEQVNIIRRASGPVACQRISYVVNVSPLLSPQQGQDPQHVSTWSPSEVSNFHFWPSFSCLGGLLGPLGLHHGYFSLSLSIFGRFWLDFK